MVLVVQGRVAQLAVAAWGSGTSSVGDLGLYRFRVLSRDREVGRTWTFQCSSFLGSVLDILTNKQYNPKTELHYGKYPNQIMQTQNGITL